MRLRLEHLFNARRLGVSFLRNSTFVMPNSIKVNTVTVPLSFPNEGGARGAFLECLIWNEYGLRRQVGAVRTVVDIGANLGFFAIAARSSYPDAVIHAYEPNPRTVPHLAANVSALDITIFPEAIGSTAGKVQILDQADSILATTSTSSDGTIGQVPLSIVLARVGGSIDLLKMDCEGAEWECFKSTECWKEVKELRMEYHLGSLHTFDEVTDTLRRLGFRIILHRPAAATWGIVWATQMSQRA
jgi:FkbM family methyltransferase